LRHTTRFVSGLLAVVCCVSGCRHRVTATAPFAHDVCGVPVYVGVRVTTEAGAPVGDAEVWRVFEPTLTPPEPTRAELWGTTDAAGQLLAPECYASGADTSDWARRPDATRLVCMIVHPQFGMVRSVVAPQVGEVLTAVKQLPPTLQPGQPWSNYTVRMNAVVPQRR
jgi:hypothetical protein